MEKTEFSLAHELEKNFRDAHLVDYFQTLYRFRIASDVRLGKVFGFLEDKKKEVRILLCSVKQSSIEQIFNAFANTPLESSLGLKKEERKATKDNLRRRKKVSFEE